MRKRFTKEDIEKAAYAIITYPTMGSLHLRISNVIKASDGKEYVEGFVWGKNGNGWNMPDDYQGEDMYMNFPITCIKELSE